MIALQKRLNELFYYKDGYFFYKEDGKYNAKKDQIVGYKHNQGYWSMSIDNKKYLAHRLVWLYYHGYFPALLDHIDGNKLNNNIENLRIANHSQNQHNRRINKNNTVGVKGICIQKVKIKGKIYTYYKAAISRDYKSISKTFTEKSDAIQFLNETRRDLHGSYACFK